VVAWDFVFKADELLNEKIRLVPNWGSWLATKMKKGQASFYH